MMTLMWVGMTKMKTIETRLFQIITVLFFFALALQVYSLSEQVRKLTIPINIHVDRVCPSDRTPQKTYQ